MEGNCMRTDCSGQEQAEEEHEDEGKRRRRTTKYT
jgi:hypothetical protein